MRHGLSLHNQIGKFSGRIDSPLTDEGRLAVKITGESIKDLSIDVIVCSPLSRAHESAEIIADVIGYPKTKILVSDLFSERDFGVLEGTKYIPIEVTEEVEGIESIDDLMLRAEKGFSLLSRIESNNVLLVSHGAIGRALRYVISQEYPMDHPSKFHNSEVVKLI